MFVNIELNVILLSLAEIVRVPEVHRRMKAVYTGYALSLTSVRDWLKCFREGRGLVNDDTGRVKVISSSRRDIIISSLHLWSHEEGIEVSPFLLGQRSFGQFSKPI